MFYSLTNAMDPLINIPIEQWSEIQNQLKDMWPRNVAGFYALKQNIKYPNVREAFQFQVYSPFGDVRNGFVATSIKGDPDCIIFPTTKDTQKLEEALLKTKIIDWTKNLCIDLVTAQTLDILKNKIFPTLNLRYCKIGTVKTYFFDRNKKPFDFRLPGVTYLAPLDQNHVRRVDDTWPYKHDASYFYFSTLAANGLGQGLYSGDHQLLAWVFVNEFHFICHLYSEEQHRRKGYAECLLKYTVNEQLAQGYDVYTYVEDRNESSSRLFDKLGFANIDNGAYVFTKK